MNKYFGCHENAMNEIAEPNMKNNNLSQTAEIIAMHRAREAALPESERICNDPYAKYFLSRKMIKRSKSWIYREIIGRIMHHFLFPGMNGSVVARVRYFDEYLKTRIADGLGQLVLVGAGYDTRAYRFGELGKTVKVFEMDYPVTQERKKEKIKEIFGALPVHVVYVPISREKEKLDRLLIENGFDRNLKTLFILEGVVMYMPPEAVDETLGLIAENSGKGSAVIFDSLDRSVVNGTSKHREGRSLFRWVKNVGEPLRFGIDPNEIEEFMLRRGFSDVKIVDTEFCKNLYFDGQNKKRKVSGIFRFVYATV
jgi:methyltransferase (TIGR00027 family)